MLAELAFFRDRPLASKPGSRFKYSNSNYEVLGAANGRVTGEKYGELLKERIFDPLGMRDIVRDMDGVIQLKRAQRYERDPMGPRRRCLGIAERSLGRRIH